jgi:hypothetical protein
MASTTIFTELTVVAIITGMTTGTGSRYIRRSTAPMATAATQVAVRIDQSKAGLSLVVE